MGNGRGRDCVKFREKIPKASAAGGGEMTQSRQGVICYCASRKKRVFIICSNFERNRESEAGYIELVRDEMAVLYVMDFFVLCINTKNIESHHQRITDQSRSTMSVLRMMCFAVVHDLREP